MKPNALSDIKLANRQLLYNCIYEKKLATMTDLEHMTKLSRPTIVGLIRDMLKEGDVVKAGVHVSRGGRAPSMYKINPHAFYTIGVDVEFPAVRIAICDLEGSAVRVSKVMLPSDYNKDQTLSGIIEQLEALMAACEIEKHKYIGIGIGLPGVIDIDSGTSVIIEKIQGWEQVPVVKILSERFDLPVYVQNDVNLLTLAERRLWPGSDMRNMLCVTIRTGIGMGVMVGDKLFNGAGGNAGRIGHLSVDFDGPECMCGGRGCLTLYTSERAIVHHYAERTGRRAESGREVASLAHDGDPIAREMLESAGRYIGLGIVSLVNLFDVENVVVLADFESDYLLGAAQNAIDSRSDLFKKRAILLFSGRLQEDMYASGGCALVLEHHRKGPRLRTEPA